MTAGWNAFMSFVPSLVATAALLVLIAVAGIVIRMRRDRMFHGATLNSIDTMDGTQFEEFLTVLFVHLGSVSYTHLRAHETRHDLVCRLLLEKKKKNTHN